jgi:hypothetical protein
MNHAGFEWFWDDGQTANDRAAVIIPACLKLRATGVKGIISIRCSNAA